MLALWLGVFLHRTRTGNAIYVVGGDPPQRAASQLFGSPHDDVRLWDLPEPAQH